MEGALLTCDIYLRPFMRVVNAEQDSTVVFLLGSLQ